MVSFELLPHQREAIERLKSEGTFTIILEGQPITERGKTEHGLRDAIQCNMTGTLVIEPASRASLEKFIRSLTREAITLEQQEPEPRRRKAQWKQERYSMGKRGSR